MIRTHHAALAAIAALAIAGCGKQDSIEAKNESVESVAGKVAASDIKPRPGRWESSMKLDKMEVSNLPSAAREAMASQQGVTQTFASCLTPEQAARPNAEFFQKGASGCTYETFTMAGGKMDAAMSCKQGAGVQKVKMNGAYGPDNYSIALTSEGEMQPGMIMKMAMTVTSRRTGECTGKGRRMTLRIEDAKPAIGGIVHVDRAHLLDDATVQACREALEDRGVLVFPRACLTDEEQLAFTDKFGTRVKFTGTVPGGEGGQSGGASDELYKITLDEEFNIEPDYVLGTFFWHIDGVTIDQPLPKATMLSARRLSPTGGQTEFASTLAAYAALPQAMKDRIDGLKVIHRMEASMRPLFVDMPAERLERYRAMATVMLHPLVWTQKSGRKSLVLGTHADEIEGIPLAAGRALITELTEWCASPRFVYRHEWEDGDFVVWNNCGVMHRVQPYPANCGRMMHRTTIFGEERLGHPLRALQAA